MTKEEIKAYHHQWYLKNKEKINAQTKAWHEANRDKHNAMNRKWGETHKAERLEITKRHHMKRYLDCINFKWEEVEGFDGWVKNTTVHHRLEAWGYSRDDLKAMGCYKNCCPDELICMAPDEHMSLHWYIRGLYQE